MTIRKNINYPNTFYFCTITCYIWLTLLQLTKLYDHIYNWFDLLLKTRKIKISAYVIMPNHIHLVFFTPNSAENINKIFANGKRFMAYEIIKRLKTEGENEVLSILEQGVSEKEKRRNKIHKVFEVSFDLKILNTEKFIVQKINYIHANPVSKKWNLVDDYRKYPHSSAGFYEGDEEYKGYPVHTI